MPKTDLLQGTLDLLILKVLMLGPNHGWGISTRIRQMSREGLDRARAHSTRPSIGSSSAATSRSEMDASENNRRARVYRLTPAGRRRLKRESARWERFALSMKRILRAT